MEWEKFDWDGFACTTVRKSDKITASGGRGLDSRVGLNAHG